MSHRPSNPPRHPLRPGVGASVFLAIAVLTVGSAPLAQDSSSDTHDLRGSPPSAFVRPVLDHIGVSTRTASRLEAGEFERAFFFDRSGFFGSSGVRSSARRGLAPTTIVPSAEASGPQQIVATTTHPFFRRVAEVGTPAPGDPGLVFEQFGTINFFFQDMRLQDPPHIDRDGNIVFHAFIGDDGIPNPGFGVADFPRGLYERRNGVLSLIFHAGIAGGMTPDGSEAPGTSDIFTNLSLGRSLFDGKVTFFGAVLPPIPTTFLGAFGIWSNRFGDYELVFHEDDPLPGIPYEEGFANLTFSSAGGNDTVIVDMLYDDTNDPIISTDLEGIWRDRTGTFELIAIDGMHAPGTLPGVFFAETGIDNSGPFRRWSANVAGDLIIVGHLDGTGINVLQNKTNNEGFWVERGDGLELLVREGDPAPGGFTWGSSTGSLSFRTGNAENITPHITDSGRVLIGGIISDETYGRYHSIWAERDDGLALIAKGVKIAGGSIPGDPAPGTPGFFFSSFVTGVMNNSGDVAFWALVDDQFVTPFQSTLGIWSNASGELDVVAHQGNPVPGLPGVIYASVAPIVLYDSGTLLFAASFAGNGVTLANDSALMRADPNGSIEIVLRRGDQVFVGTNDTRTVDIFSVGIGTTRRGHRVFEIFFTDGTNGLFTASVFDRVVRKRNKAPQPVSSFRVR